MPSVNVFPLTPQNDEPPRGEQLVARVAASTPAQCGLWDAGLPIFPAAILENSAVGEPARKCWMVLWRWAGCKPSHVRCDAGSLMSALNAKSDRTVRGYRDELARIGAILVIDNGPRWVLYVNDPEEVADDRPRIKSPGRWRYLAFMEEGEAPEVGGQRSEVGESAINGGNPAGTFCAKSPAETPAISPAKSPQKLPQKVPAESGNNSQDFSTGQTSGDESDLLSLVARKKAQLQLEVALDAPKMIAGAIRLPARERETPSEPPREPPDASLAHRVQERTERSQRTPDLKDQYVPPNVPNVPRGGDLAAGQNATRGRLGDAQSCAEAGDVGNVSRKTSGANGSHEPSRHEPSRLRDSLVALHRELLAKIGPDQPGWEWQPWAVAMLHAAALLSDEDLAAIVTAGRSDTRRGPWAAAWDQAKRRVALLGRERCLASGLLRWDEDQAARDPAYSPPNIDRKGLWQRLAKAGIKKPWRVSRGKSRNPSPHPKP